MVQSAPNKQKSSVEIEIKDFEAEREEIVRRLPQTD